MLESLASDPKILFLLAQTRAYLSGPDFAHALTCALDRATDVLIDGLNARVFVERGAILTPFEGKIKEHRPQGDSSQVAGAEVPQEAQTMKLVGLLPDLARWSQRALNATPNELVDVCHFLDHNLNASDGERSYSEYHGSSRGGCAGSHYYF